MINDRMHPARIPMIEAKDEIGPKFRSICPDSIE
jgi:hypothetical protein